MKQIARNYRSGELAVLEVPVPATRPGGVLVRTQSSLISTGTEMMKINESKLSPVGKALTLPDALAWRRLEGQADPPAGWYSPAFGARVPTVTLVGSGRIGDGPALTTVLQLDRGTTP